MNLRHGPAKKLGIHLKDCRNNLAKGNSPRSPERHSFTHLRCRPWANAPAGLLLMGEIVIILYWVKIFVFVRRMVLVVCSAVRVAVGVWDCLFMPPQWRSWVLLQWCLWRQRPSFCRGRSRFFVCFMGQFSLYQWEAHRWHSTASMQWRHGNVDQGVRRTV